jgi:hypothetical protein
MEDTLIQYEWGGRLGFCRFLKENPGGGTRNATTNITVCEIFQPLLWFILG